MISRVSEIVVSSKMTPLCLFLFGFCLVGLAAGQPVDPESKVDDDLDTKIIGGVRAPEGAYPFQVSIQAEDAKGSRFKFCGGAIIKKDWIITAAHCIDQFAQWKGIRMYVKAGAVDAAQTLSGNEQYVDVLHSYKHPSYTGPFNENDIALLELKSPLNFTKRIQAIALPPAGYVPVGNGEILGWGATANPPEKNQARFLMVATIPITPKQECLEYFPELTDKHVCPGTNGKSSCAGDSGGPLIQKIGGHKSVVGVSSYSKRPCGEYPSVYVRVSAFIDDFINPKISA